MFMQLIIQLTACSLAMAITDLESQCNSIGGNLTHIYANGSCYVLHPQAVLYMFAKLSCNDILGYGGHLVHPKSSAEIDILLTMQQSGGVGYSWIGVEQPDWNSANNVGWYYTTPMDDNSPATYVKWKSGEPNGGWTANDENNVVLVLAVRSYEDWPLFAAHPYLCQYEESRKRPMTDLEQKCASVNSSFTHAFFNGNCYVFHPQTTPYYVAKLSCNDLAGYDGHLAFLKSVNDKNMAESLMRASIATGYRQAWVGVEQPDWNAANNVGWSYTTPTTESELATYLPWSSGEPGGGSYENIAALDATYTANYQDFPYTSTLSPLCRYEPSSRRNVTALETSCNQLATPNKYYYAGTCFFESASAATYSAKKTACPAMAPYYASLAILDTAEKRILARNIGKKSLSAASLDVKNLAYWTSLEQRPACPNNACNEEPGKSWYWIDSAGNTYSADLSNQGWASTYPSDSTNSKQLATLRYNGYTDVTDTTTALGLCQYSTLLPTTTTSTTTSTTTTTTRPACTTPLTTTAGGTGTAAATTYAERITSTFNHYRFGYFTNTCYWLDQLTVTFSKCLNMCHENNLCFGFSYNAGTSDCQLLAIIASASPYWFELTADRQYETVIRE